MTFKERLLKDRDIFLDGMYFGSTHRLDGKIITCVLDDPTTGTTDKSVQPDLEVGLSFGDYVLRAKSEELPKIYAANMTCLLDGKSMLILKTVEADGMTYLTLKEHATW